MKTLKLIALTAFALLFSQCKTTAPTQAPAGTASMIETARVLDTVAKKFLIFAAQTNGNPQKSLMLAAEWIKTQPNIRSAQAQDSTYINILLNSGLWTTFSIDLTDGNGRSLFKGGRTNNKNIPPLMVTSTRATNEITNKNVLLYLAAFSQFYTDAQIQKIVNYFGKSGIGFVVTVLKDSQCSYRTVETFKDYGLVIVDTHGNKDLFLTGSTFSIYPDVSISEEKLRAIIVQQLGQDCLDKLLNGELQTGISLLINANIPGWAQIADVGRKIQILTTTKYIDVLPQMPGTVVFANTCFSGESLPTYSGRTPIRTSFIGKNLISYYGYAFNDGSSESVSVPFSNAMLDTFVHAFVIDFDSTGITNLKPDHSTEYDDPDKSGLFFKHFGADDYSYAKCLDSFIDARDGHLYHSICIGRQTWMVENLDFDPGGSGSGCYNDDPANCPIYGRLYDWASMMQGELPTDANPSRIKGVCPLGWHIPSWSEFTQLTQFLGGFDVAGGAMKNLTGWQNDVGATNSSGFSALPGGYNFSIGSTGASLGIGTTASFSSCTIDTRTGRNFGILIHSFDATVGNDAGHDPTSKSAVSCRCLKDP